MCLTDIKHWTSRVNKKNPLPPFRTSHFLPPFVQHDSAVALRTTPHSSNSADAAAQSFLPIFSPINLCLPDSARWSSVLRGKRPPHLFNHRRYHLLFFLHSFYL